MEFITFPTIGSTDSIMVALAVSITTWGVSNGYDKRR